MVIDSDPPCVRPSGSQTNQQSSKQINKGLLHAMLLKKKAMIYLCKTYKVFLFPVLNSIIFLFFYLKRHILQLPFEVLDTGVAIDMATACLHRIF